MWRFGREASHVLLRQNSAVGGHQLNLTRSLAVKAASRGKPSADIEDTEDTSLRQKKLNIVDNEVVEKPKTKKRSPRKAKAKAATITPIADSLEESNSNDFDSNNTTINQDGDIVQNDIDIDSTSLRGAHVLLIDGWPLLFRQYYGMRNADNIDDRTVFMKHVAVSYLRKITRVIKYTEPTHVSIIFDGHGARQSRQEAIHSARDAAERNLEVAKEESMATLTANVATTLQELHGDMSTLEYITQSFDSICSITQTLPPVMKDRPVQKSFTDAADKLTNRLEAEVVDAKSQPVIEALTTHVEKLGDRIGVAELAILHDDENVAQMATQYIASLEIFTETLNEYTLNIERFSREAASYTEEASSTLSRMENYPGYKSNREQAPDDISQIFYSALARFQKQRIHAVCPPGMEADDVIATIAVKARGLGAKVDIVSPDKDFLQLIDTNTRILKPNRTFSFPRDAPSASYARVVHQAFDVLDEASFQKVFPGIVPTQHIDYLSLVGDSADNIPGVKYVGPKSALKLLSAHGTVEAIVEHVQKGVPKTRPEKMVKEHANTALFGKELVRLSTNLDLPWDLSWEDMELQYIEEL
mmetsp:Transcript_919/g.2142  ORF Transcript_919/g.2142 Transcript_919/m.2142 type:complete len:588 (+) Transcript_919:95-1858(+)